MHNTYKYITHDRNIISVACYCSTIRSEALVLRQDQLNFIDMLKNKILKKKMSDLAFRC